MTTERVNLEVRREAVRIVAAAAAGKCHSQQRPLWGNMIPRRKTVTTPKTQARFEGGVLSKCVYLSVAPPLWVKSAFDRK